MSGVNKVILVGNLGAKPEATFTKSGIPMTKFRIATTEWIGKDESGNKKEHTEWHRIVTWRGLAEVCDKYLDKGTKVYIEGKIRTNKWTGDDNVTRYTTEIIADNMVILTPKGTRESVPEMEVDAPGVYPSSSGTSFPPKDSGTGGGATNVDLDKDEDLDNTFL
ncbi:single-stranded DNA-binding protein [bacterium]|nr:single-stranded DNA-binding protein [bacterium]